MADKFLYVTFIRTTPEKLWEALTNPDFMRQYWFGCHAECTWEKGAPWKLVFPDGRVGDMGEVIESDPPRSLVLKWRNEFRPELKEEGYSVCRFTLEQAPGAVKLTLLHSIDRTGSKLIEAVSGGWPKVLSGLKSLLETGTPLDDIHAFGKAAS